MEMGEMLSDSFEYTKEGLMGKWMKWFLLVICTIIFPLIYGYTVRIFRGMTPAPELEDWIGLFVDGIKLLIIYILYMIPVFIVFILLAGGAITAMATGNDTLIAAGIGGMLLGIGITAIIALIIFLFAIIGSVRFSRTDSMGEAFNFSAILETIRSIGWVDYIIALIVLYIIMFIISFIIGLLTSIPIIGWIIYFFSLPAITIFGARYIALLYDSANVIP